MPRSHIHRSEAGLATDTIRHYSWQSVLAVDFRIAAVVMRSGTCISLTVFEHAQIRPRNK